MQYNFSESEEQQMGIAPLIPVAIAAVPAISKIFSSIFGSKKRKKVTPPPPPPAQKIPVWVWVAGGTAFALLGTTVIVSMGRGRRRR